MAKYLSMDRAIDWLALQWHPMDTTAVAIWRGERFYYDGLAADRRMIPLQDKNLKGKEGSYAIYLLKVK